LTPILLFLRFTFDGLDRLDKITDSYLGSGDVNYDTMGNITYYKLGSRTINYRYNSKKQLAYTTGSKAYNFAYDDKGNVTDNGTRVFDYNTANQMVQSGGYSYTYDANNKRVRQEDSKGISYSFYGSNGKLMYRNANNKHIDYYYLGGKLVAKNKDDTITYLHSDYLGSTAAESNDVNSSIYRMHYQPFGESIETPKDDVGYTGHKFDTDLGLSYMQARYYDPVIGRFYSNDPVGFTNVHTFNRYAYANNNPYKYVDPDGRTAIMHMIPKPPNMSPMEHANAVSGVTAGKVIASATTLKVSVGAPGLKGNFKAPNSPLSIDAGFGLTGGVTIDDNGLSVNLNAEAAIEGTDTAGNTGKVQLAKGSLSLPQGKTTPSLEGPKAEFSSASGGTLESDGVMKVGGKLGFAQVEMEIDTNTKIE
jgi:RHS repeat-associated protein